MSGPRFHETVVGRHFLEGTMPRLVEEVARLNEHLERLIEVLEKRAAPDVSDPGDEGDRDAGSITRSR